MTQQRSNTLILGTSFLAAVIAVLAYLFYFSPTIDATSAAREAAANQKSVNDVFEIEVASLAARFAKLPEIRAEIVEVQQDLPPAEAIPEVLRTLVAAAEGVGLSLETVSIGTPAPVGNTVSLAGAAAAVGKASYIEGLAFQNLNATSFTVAGIGDQAVVFDLIDALQLGDHRYMLVENVTMTPLEPAPATETTPEILPGAVSFEITGEFFTLIETGIDPNSLSNDPDFEPLEPITRDDLSDPADI